MRVTNEGAQLAMGVAERIASSAPWEDAAWMDETLLGWSQLPAGRSAIARALSEVWPRQMPNQIARFIRDGTTRSKGIGFVPSDLIRQADALATDPRFIREQDIVAGLLAWQPRALLEQGLDGERLLA